MRLEIYKQLIHTEGFVSGGHISEALGITRAALWKHIKAMQTDGALIESVTGKGYKLVQPPSVPRAEYVRAHLSSDIPVFFEERTASTNESAKAAAQDSSLTAAVFLAGEQTAGKGRKGRSWVSLSGQGIYLTMLVRPKIEPSSVSGITLMAAVAVCEAIEQTANIKAQIKWPNDIVIEGKKTAGILTESMMHMDGVDYVVCGIGINTGSSAFGSALSKSAGALQANNTLLAAAVISRFLDAYSAFIKYGVAVFMPAFRERNALSGTVTLLTSDGRKTGKHIGFDNDGAIIIDCGGEQRSFIAGEVSLRGEKGYV